MKNRKYLAILMACVLAFGMMALVGCGGQQQSGSAPAAPSGPTDEELIAEDFSHVFDDIFTADGIKAIVESTTGDALASLESLGVTVDYDAFANAFKQVFVIEVTSVQVNGDTAVADVSITYPDYGSDAGQAAMNDAMNKAIEGVDLQAIAGDPDELSKVLNDAMIAGLTSSDIPTTTQSDKIDYEKVDGTWQMKDKDELTDALSQFL